MATPPPRRPRGNAVGAPAACSHPDQHRSRRRRPCAEHAARVSLPSVCFACDGQPANPRSDGVRARSIVRSRRPCIAIPEHPRAHGKSRGRTCGKHHVGGHGPRGSSARAAGAAGAAALYSTVRIAVRPTARIFLRARKWKKDILRASKLEKRHAPCGPHRSVQPTSEACGWLSASSAQSPRS